MLCALRHPDGEALRKRIGADSDCVLRAYYTPWEVGVVCPPAPRKACGSGGAARAGRSGAQGGDRARDRFRSTRLPRRPRCRRRFPASGLAAVQAESAREAALSRPAFLGAKGMTPAERGTALHDFMQFSDFSAAADDPEAERRRLVEAKFLTAEQAQAVDLHRVRRFRVAARRRVLGAERVQEQRFIAQVPASSSTRRSRGGRRPCPSFCRGAVDCMFEENGRLYIIDFKTDRCADKAELWRAYGTQLVLYGEAMACVFKKPVAACMLYSFWLGEPVLPETTEL